MTTNEVVPAASTPLSGTPLFTPMFVDVHVPPESVVRRYTGSDDRLPTPPTAQPVVDDANFTSLRVTVVPDDCDVSVPVEVSNR